MVQAMQTGSVGDWTLQDLLSEHADALEGSYAEVSPDATIEEAMEAMAAKPGCQDVYVTRDGLVIGWLPNVVFLSYTYFTFSLNVCIFTFQSNNIFNPRDLQFCRIFNNDYSLIFWDVLGKHIEKCRFSRTCTSGNKYVVTRSYQLFSGNPPLHRVMWFRF